MHPDPRDPHRLELATIIFVALSALLGMPAMGEEIPSMEHQVKAAMILNFAQFVEWPAQAYPSADAPIVIAVVGAAGPYASAIEQATSGKTVGGRRLVVNRVPSAEAIGACQVLVCADAEASRAVARVETKPVLTIGDTEPFMKAGGVIRFYTESNKVRFEVSPAAAEKAGLKVSSKLLKLARIYNR